MALLVADHHIQQHFLAGCPHRGSLLRGSWVLLGAPGRCERQRHGFETEAHDLARVFHCSFPSLKRTNPDIFHSASRFEFDDPKTCGVPRAARVLAYGRLRICPWTPGTPWRQAFLRRGRPGILRRNLPVYCSLRGAGHDTPDSRFARRPHRSICCPSADRAESECSLCSDYPAAQSLPMCGDTARRSLTLAPRTVRVAWINPSSPPVRSYSAASPQGVPRWIHDSACTALPESSCPT